MQTTHEGRTYEVTATETGANLAKHLQDSGFEPQCYHGLSLPVGRQRRAYAALFYRGQKSGELQFIVRV